MMFFYIFAAYKFLRHEGERKKPRRIAYFAIAIISFVVMVYCTFVRPSVVGFFATLVFGFSFFEFCYYCRCFDGEEYEGEDEDDD